MVRVFLVLAGFFFLSGEANLSGARIKDIAFLKGGRANQLIGFSLVIGLNGTGDSPESLASRKPLVNALERLGVTLTPADIRGRSVAAVIVTAELLAYAKTGQRLDVVVSALGDAITLKGGVLVMTPLRAADSQIYAVAQGQLTDIPSGIELPGSFELTGNRPLRLDPHQNYLPTVGRVVGGALVEKAIVSDLNLRTHLYLNLLDPDFTTAYRISQAINNALAVNTAKAEDAGTVAISVPRTYLNRAVELIATIENLEVLDDNVAKVVIDERTGIIVIGENVTVNPVAISYNNLNLLIKDQGIFPNTAYESPTTELDSPGVAPTQLPLQAAQQTAGAAAGAPELSVPQEEKNNILVFKGGVNLKDLANGLNKIGVTNRELINILKNIKAAGAIKAELVFR